jgi:hypothetical protein
MQPKSPLAAAFFDSNPKTKLLAALPGEDASMLLFVQYNYDLVPSICDGGKKTALS